MFRWFFAILFIIFGALLLSLTVDQIGNIGHIIIKIIGMGSIFIAGLIVKNNKK